VQSVQGKQGRSGTLNFVVVHHQILQGSNVVIDGQQDPVYREPAEIRDFLPDLSACQDSLLGLPVIFWNHARTRPPIVATGRTRTARGNLRTERSR
jgi:hypothetical protein